MIRHGDLPKVCRSCRIHHVENCGECYGFGLRLSDLPTGHTVPIIYAEAHGVVIPPPLGCDGSLPAWRPCPECGGTPFNYGLQSENRDSNSPNCTQLV
jgi:hypothetical protein